MTISTAIASAALRVTGDRLGSVYSNDAQIAVELSDLANEVAEDIARSHQWQALTRFATLVGDGTQTAFDLPADYDRMLIAGDVHRVGQMLWGYYKVDVEEWLDMQSGGFHGRRNAWIMMGGQMQFSSAPTGQARFAYISKAWARGETGDAKTAFDRDDDTFILDEGLLRAGLTWRYREQKGLEYAEDMASFERSLSQLQVRDGGPTVIRRYGRGQRTYATVPEIVIAGDGVTGEGANTDYVAIYEANQ